MLSQRINQEKPRLKRQLQVFRNKNWNSAKRRYSWDFLQTRNRWQLKHLRVGPKGFVK